MYVGVGGTPPLLRLAKDLAVNGRWKCQSTTEEILCQKSENVDFKLSILYLTSILHSTFSVESSLKVVNIYLKISVVLYAVKSHAQQYFFSITVCLRG